MTAAIPELARLIPEGLPRGLRNYWYPVLQSEEPPAARPVGFAVLGEKLVAWRDASGKPCVLVDRCPHRSMPLSKGRVLEGELQCVLHGLRFAGSGRCTLIPWETERSEQHERVGARSYPAEELGGYVWVYVGDTSAHPPTELASEVPEELSRPGEFVWFRLPTQIWKANWLLAIDGSDGFHAVTLHAESQAVADRPWEGGRVREAEVPLAERRVKIVRTSHGIRGVSVDTKGTAIQHGHFTADVKGDRFSLPCIHTNPIMPAPGALPYAARLWQFPIDETHTQVVRFLSWRATTAEERARAKQVFEDVALQRLERVAAEDAWAAEAQGDLIEARSNECLLPPDADVVKVRRRIAEAFLAPLEKGARVPVPSSALVFPI